MAKKLTEEQDGWNEYSKLVLAELLRLGDNDEKNNKNFFIHSVKVQDTLSEINLKLAKLEVFEKELGVIEKWKSYMEDVATPSVLRKIKEDVATLNTFKTVATTVWAVVQIAFGILVALYAK